MQIVQNKRNDLVQLLGDHADPALDVEAENEMIHHDAAKVGAQNAEHHRFGIVAQRGSQSHRDTGNGHGFSHIHLQILVHDFCHNIQATGGGILGEQNGKTHAHQQNIADHIQQRILGNGLKIRKQQFKYTQNQRHQHGAIYRFDAKFRPHQQKADDQQTDIHDHGNGGNRQRNKVAQHHSQRSAAAHGNMAGQHKKVHRRRHDHRADCKQRKLSQGFSNFHGEDLISQKSLFIIRAVTKNANCFFVFYQ